MADGIKELQQRLLDMEKELEMKEARNKQVTKEVCAVCYHSSASNLLLGLLAVFCVLVG